MHLATRGNNKILRTPPPHISSSVEILPRLNRRTLAQLRTNKSPFLNSYLHKVNVKTHPSPLRPLCNTHTHDIHHLFNCTHICTTLSLAGGPQAGRSDSPPPLARVMGASRQQYIVEAYSSMGLGMDLYVAMYLSHLFSPCCSYE